MTCWRLGLVVGLSLLGGCYLSREPGEAPGPPPPEVVLPALPEIEWVADPFAGFEGVKVVAVGRERERGEAIVVFQTSSSGGQVRAFWYDGEGHFTKAVRLGEAALSDEASPVEADVAFVDTRSFTGTSGAATANGRARHGDALIAFTATGAEPDDRDVYLTVFDRSAIGFAVAGHDTGFVTTSVPVSPPHVASGPAGGTQYSQIQILSDAFDGPVWRESPEARVRRSGRATTSAAITFSAYDPSWEHQKLFANAIDLGSGGYVPSVTDPGSSAIVLVPPSVPGHTASSDGQSIAHGSCLFWSSYDDFGNGGTLTTCIRGTTLRTASFASVGPLSGISGEIVGVVGPPDGLDVFYVTFLESAYGDDSTGSRASDTDLMIARVVPDGSTHELIEADVYTSVVDATDVDHDGDLRIPGTRGDVVVQHQQLSADRSLLYLEMAQRATQSGDLDDRNPAVGAPATTYVSYLRVLDVGPADKPLAERLSAPIGVPHFDARGDVRSPDRFEPGGVTAFQFQTGTDAESWQRDSARLGFTYELLDANSAPGSELRNNGLYANRVDVTRSSRGKPAIALAYGTLQASRIPMPGDQILQTFEARTIDGTSVGEAVRVVFRALDPSLVDASTGGPARTTFVWDGHARTRFAAPDFVPYRYAKFRRELVLTPRRAHIVDVVLDDRPWDGSTTRLVHTLGRADDFGSMQPPVDTPTLPLADEDVTLTPIEPPPPLVAENRVVILGPSDGEVLRWTSETDFENADARRPMCVDCETDLLQGVFVVPARAKDTIADTLVFVSRGEYEPDRMRVHVLE